MNQRFTEKLSNQPLDQREKRSTQSILSDAVILEKNRHALVSYYQETRLLRLTWLERTRDLNGGECRMILEIFSDFAMELEARGILTDLRDFLYEDCTQLPVWHQKVIVPKYNRATLRYACLTSNGTSPLPAAGKPYQGYDQSYTTQWFNLLPQAIRWAARLEDSSPATG